MLSFACSAGGKSAAAALGRVASPAPGLCWGAGQKGKRYTCAAKAGLLDVGCSTCLLPALCCPAAWKGSQPFRKRESHRAPQPHLAGFYLCSDTHSPQLAWPEEPDTIHQICWVPSRTVWKTFFGKAQNMNKGKSLGFTLHLKLRGKTAHLRR